MSALAILIVAIGIGIILTRGPLVVAPQHVRAIYLGLFDTDSKMRLLGATIGTMGAIAVWAALGVAGTLAAIVNGIGLFMIAAAAWMIITPHPARNLASKIWLAFGATTMRILGAFAVLFGIFLVYYGLSL